MSSRQRYVSEELTHFVGRTSTSSEEDRYQLLVRILRGGWLTHPPHDPTLDPNRSKNFTIEFRNRLSENRLFNTNVVCFCDIPPEDFAIHMAKYSRFGLSFSRQYLVMRGANPVFYVANNSRMLLSNPMIEHPREPPGVNIAKELPTRTDVKRSDFFDEAIIEFAQYLTAIQILIDLEGFDLEKRVIVALDDYAAGLPETTEDEKSKKQTVRAALGILHTRTHINVKFRFMAMIEFIFLNVMGFLKLFDDAKPEDDPDNYYMEREWRVVGNVQFSLDDVRRVILPAEFARRLRQDVPDYCGQVTFSGS